MNRVGDFAGNLLETVLMAFNQYVSDNLALILIGILVVGIVLGVKEVIVVFDSFDDLVLTFSSFVIPLNVGVVLYALHVEKAAEIAIILFFLFTIYIIYLTLKWNHNPFSLLIALYVKYILSLSIVIIMFDLFSDKRKKAGPFVNVIFLIFLVGLVVRLTKNKESKYFGSIPKYLRRRGIGVD